MKKYLPITLVVLLAILTGVTLSVLRSDESDTNEELQDVSQESNINVERTEVLDGEVQFANENFKVIVDQPFGQNMNCAVLPNAPESFCLDQVVIAKTSQPDVFDQLDNYLHMALFERKNQTLQEWLEEFTETSETDEAELLDVDGKQSLINTTGQGSAQKIYAVIFTENYVILVHNTSTSNISEEDFKDFLNTMSII